jgi:threonine dehydrogenase-like Zn-dependent dehydrogenase
MHPSSQRILMLEAPGRVRLAERSLAPPGPGDVIVRSLYSTFKHGTEMMAYRAETPHVSRAFNPSLRLFENAPGEQSFYPRPLGSMVVGTVEWAGERAGDLRPGDRVFGFAPIADVHVMPATSVRKLGALTPEQALCIDPASFALGGVLDGEISKGETVLVTGLGAIGLFAVQYCVALGARVVAASGLEERRRLAQSFGASEAHDTSADGDVARTIKERMVSEGMAGVDAAIECSGSLATLAMAIRAARQCGRVVCVGFYGPGTINLGEEFFHNRLTLLASLPALTWNNPVRGIKPLYAKDLQELAARDFAAGKITPRGILSPTLAFRDAEQAVKLIADEPQRVLKVLLTHD